MTIAIACLVLILILLGYYFTAFAPRVPEDSVAAFPIVFFEL